MRNQLPFVFRPLLALAITVLVVSVSLGQSNGLPDAATWKTSTLAELDRQLAIEATDGSSRRELNARRTWLENWSPGNMTSQPTRNPNLPTTRTEPILDTRLSKEFRRRLMDEDTEQDEAVFLILTQTLAEHPNDIGLQQLHLHWMDLPIRRKTYLKQIDASAVRLIKALKNRTATNATHQLATEFALYRLGRALAYQELPDVVKKTPIEDAQRLNQRILSAYQELIAAAGKGRSEFILLEIRMLRRAGYFGSSLSLVEKYGSAIKPQWYLKKRRDLLKELEWNIPQSEAAKIYADEFPEEAVKEKS